MTKDTSNTLVVKNPIRFNEQVECYSTDYVLAELLLLLLNDRP